MTLEEYWEEFRNSWPEPYDGDIPISIAPIIYAGFKAGIPPEQLLKIQIDVLKMKNVLTAFDKNSVKAEVIEKIERAYSSGCVKPDEVLRAEFNEKDVHEKFRKPIFHK